MSFEFLTVEDVLEIHRLQLGRFGGGDGLRDLGLLESALAQPSATFGGEYLHADLFEMAAAYLFHIVSNHPFLDGNKRVGLLAALVFLDLNGVSLLDATDRFYDLTIAVASGSLEKRRVAETLRAIASDPHG
ncbi:MAG: type II toxin-antitoxin system death-on-curing family toxin [Archangiaceae bacterium]|nr:type II toxin-antitoxin system death-on-curing family toxin [Archangiaceae bacterium]